MNRAHKSFNLRCAGCDRIQHAPTSTLHVVETTDNQTELWWPCPKCGGWNNRGLRNYQTRPTRSLPFMDDVEDQTVARYCTAGAHWHDLSDLEADLVGLLEDDQ